MIEYPIEVKDPTFVISTLWLRPIGVGLLFVFLAWLLDLRIRRRKETPSKT
jgi:hypothetical protein